MPALIQDRPVQPGFLAHHASRFGKGAFGTGGHAFGVQALKHNRPEAFAETQSGPMVPILADTPLTGLYGGNTASLLGIAGRAALAAAKNPLGLSFAPFKACKAGRHGHQFARGQGKRLRNSTVNTNAGWQRRSGSIMLNGKAKADVPAIRRKADCGIIHLADKRAGIAETHPTDFGQVHLGPLAVQLAGFDLTALEAERVVQALFARAGVLGDAFEEVLPGTVQIAQGLLLRRYGDSTYPVVFSAQKRQLTGLAGVADVVSGIGLEQPPMIATLLQRQVVSKAANARKLRERSRLLVGWVQLETVAAMDHVWILAFGPRSASAAADTVLLTEPVFVCCLGTGSDAVASRRRNDREANTVDQMAHTAQRIIGKRRRYQEVIA